MPKSLHTRSSAGILRALFVGAEATGQDGRKDRGGAVGQSSSQFRVNGKTVSLFCERVACAPIPEGRSKAQAAFPVTIPNFI